MLSPEDRQRIEEEEAYRSEVRRRIAAATPPPAIPKGATRIPAWLVVVLGIASIPAVLILVGSILPTPAATGADRIGSQYKFNGKVILVNDDRSYIDVEAEGLRVRCVHFETHVPAVGDAVLVVGKVVKWTDGVAVTLAGCQVVR